MDWQQLEEFKGIDLNNSFVMDWSLDGKSLHFKLEASIWPESAYYTEPKAKSQKPKAKSQKPKAKSQKPKAKSQKPKDIPATEQRPYLSRIWNQ